MAYVYLICNATSESYKIGVTKGKIEKRIKALQTGNSDELHIASYFQTDHPFNIEKMMHNKYQQQRMSGEWFKLSNEDVVSFKDTCESFERIVESLKDNPFFHAK